LTVMERAFSVNDIFAIGYIEQLSIQRPPDPFEGLVVYSPRLFFKTRMVAFTDSPGFDDGVVNDALSTTSQKRRWEVLAFGEGS